MGSSLNSVSVVLVSVPEPGFTVLKMTELGLARWSTSKGTLPPNLMALDLSPGTVWWKGNHHQQAVL